MTDWDSIRIFAAVLRTGSFSEAARTLGTTQATVSRRVKALEAAVGTRLFVREREGVRPTDRAETLRAATAEMEAASAGWERAISDTTVGRTIVVTCGELIGRFLVRHVGALEDGIGQTHVDIQRTNAFVDIEKGEADLALRNLRPERGALRSRRLQSNDYGPFSVFGARLWFVHGQFGDVDALRDEAWISVTAPHARLPSARWISEHIGEEAIHFRMNSTAMVLEATHANRALALLPRFIGRAEPHLVEVFGPVTGLTMGMWIVRRDDGIDDPAMDRLIANIEALFARPLATDA